jgi:hypothetical protein
LSSTGVLGMLALSRRGRTSCSCWPPLTLECAEIAMPSRPCSVTEWRGASSDLLHLARSGYRLPITRVQACDVFSRDAYAVCAVQRPCASLSRVSGRSTTVVTKYSYLCGNRACQGWIRYSATLARSGRNGLTGTFGPHPESGKPRRPGQCLSSGRPNLVPQRMACMCEGPSPAVERS